MQSENFDKRIREAADHHHPNYDEMAWAKMETLLDEHMPVKEKKKRRFIPFFLLFLFAGSACWLLIQQPWENASIAHNQPGDHSVSNQHIQSGPQPLEVNLQKPSQTSSDGDLDNSDNADQGPAGDGAKDNQQAGSPNLNEGDRDFVAGKQQASIFRTKTTTGGIAKKASASKGNTPADIKTDTPDVDHNANQKSGGEELPMKLIVIDPVVGNQHSSEEGNEKMVAEKQDDTSVEQTDSSGQDTQEETPESQKDEELVAKPVKAKKKNSFFISASIGPDVSTVGSHGLGKMKLLAGAGIGFTFKERITLRTGFYAGRKLYTAGPGDYKPASPVPNPDYLYRIDADCKVYEIPVNISYNFASMKNAKLFAGAGVSSYIMKSESYDYVYKYPGSDDEHTYNWSVKDKNKHMFSVLTFSAGYERLLGKRFSLMAEPYFKLPLAGVGYGKVKMNSAGVMFSLNYRPFDK